MSYHKKGGDKHNKNEKKERKKVEEKERQKILFDLNTIVSSSSFGILFSFVGTLENEPMEEVNYDLKPKIFGSVSFLYSPTVFEILVKKVKVFGEISFIKSNNIWQYHKSIQFDADRRDTCVKLVLERSC